MAEEARVREQVLRDDVARLRARLVASGKEMDECKARMAEIAKHTPNTHVVDFMIPSPITDEPTHYWDPLHFRTPIADRLMRDLAEAGKGMPSASGDYRLLRN